MKTQEITALPDLDEYIRNNVIEADFLWYKKKPRYIDIKCSHCGQEYKIDRYSEEEEQMYGDTYSVKHKSTGKCRCCGHEGQYMSYGYGSKFTYYDTLLYGKTDNDTLIILVISAAKHYAIMEKSYVTSNVSAYAEFKKGETPHKSINDFYGNWNRSYSDKFGDIEDGSAIHPSVWESIEKTYLKYFNIEELYKGLCTYRSRMYVQTPENNIRVLRVCDKCTVYPDIEYLQKMGKHEIVNEILKGDIRIDRRRKTPWDRLAINKSRLKELESIEDLKLFRQEKAVGITFSKKNIEYLKPMHEYEMKNSIYLMRYASLEKQKHYIEKQNVLSKFKTAKSIWVDYLKMKSKAGYTMDSIAIFPKNVFEAHDKMVDEINKEKNKQREIEFDTKFQKIPSIYKRLKKKYEYEKDGLYIRMAMRAGELVKEGATLHHCVGSSDSYARKFENQETFILFLRKNKNEPYITVEFDQKNLRVLQWYGIHDTKPDEKEIEDFLKDFVVHLKEGKKKAC